MLGTATEAQGKLAYSVDDLANMTSLSKAYLRNEIRAQKLKAKKFGARVLVLVSDWQAYAAKQTDWQPTNQHNAENN